jgi:multicomponent Na+:H+ antiporter subunit B
MMLAMLAVIAIGVLVLRDLFAVVMLGGIYSLCSAAILVNMDAVDVAFTEASVGAGISTVLLLGTLALTGHREKVPTEKTHPFAFLTVLATGAALIYGTLDMPNYGDPDAPIHGHVAPRYLYESPDETGLPNVVTSVLASYRGYDTMGELAVIFTAGVGVMLILGATGRRRRPELERRSAQSSETLDEKTGSSSGETEK